MSLGNGRAKDVYGQNEEGIAFLQQMLGQLSQVARGQKEGMLTYLIDMAYEEAGEALRRRGHPVRSPTRK